MRYNLSKNPENIKKSLFRNSFNSQNRGLSKSLLHRYTFFVSFLCVFIINLTKAQVSFSNPGW